MCLDLSENKIDSYWSICQICCCCCQREGTFGHSEGNSEGIPVVHSTLNFYQILVFLWFWP